MREHASPPLIHTEMTSGPVEVSIVIPARNSSRFLRQALASIEEEDALRWEALIVEDGSTDETFEIARSLENERIRVLRHPNGANRGVSASRNLGLREAAGRHVAFLDADDLYRAGHVSACVRHLDRHPETGAVFTAGDLLEDFAEAPDGLKSAIERQNLEFGDGEPVPFERFLTDDPIRTSSVVARLPLLREIGGFDETVRCQTEDWISWAKIALRSRIVFVDAPGISYRYHPDSHTARLLGELGNRYLETIRAEVYSKLLVWLLANDRIARKHAPFVRECSAMPPGALATRREVVKRMRAVLARNARPAFVERAKAFWQGLRSP